MEILTLVRYISTIPACSQSLQMAVALLHSLEFGEATVAFHPVEAHHPSCAVAAWGVGLSNLERQGPDGLVSFLKRILMP